MRYRVAQRRAAKRSGLTQVLGALMKVFRVCVIAVAIAMLAACKGDPNAKPTFGEESGLPKNCRAIVQANIDSYRSKQYTADEVMASLERNCGTYGISWGQ